MRKEFETYWKKVNFRFDILRGLSVGIPIVSFSLLLLAIKNIYLLTIPFAFWVVYLISVISLLVLWNDKLKWKKNDLLEFLHAKYSQLEYSLSLFFKNDLNELERLQQKKVLEKLPSLQKIALPVHLQRVFIYLVASALFYFLSFFMTKEEMRDTMVSQAKPESWYLPDSIDDDQRKLKFDYSLRVLPPLYTGLNRFLWQKDLKVPEGSKIVFENSGEVQFELLWQNQQLYNLGSNDLKSFVLNEPAIFQIEYLQKDSLTSLKPEILNLIKDEPPILTTNLKDNRHEIRFEDLQNGFELDLTVEDDYGIVSTDIIMTLSRGEGESVRFREMKQAIQGVSKKLRKQQVSISLPLDTFSLTPGDELYFYFSALDNKKPKGNKGKTDVYFLSIADTAEREMLEYEGFALTNEAEYFKSQRQIIIDTESLLKDQNRISQDEFEERSNSIGADQKLLRLRYGVFLGEEFETTGGLGEIDHSGHDHGELEKHNTEDENDHDSHEGHEHESEGNFSNPIFNETPELEAYVHAHDDSELSTFLDANVKIKLKEALANMWEAELFLRTYNPKEALPYEYAALKLIKEVKRASRIYVARMGFEPPPIDENKKRLTGDLDKIDAQTVQEKISELPFKEKLANNYSQLYTCYQQMDMPSAVTISKSFTDDLVKKITSEPVRYGTLLAALKQFQASSNREDLYSILILMKDMLDLQDLQTAKQVANMQSGLHNIYYELSNE